MCAIPVTVLSVVHQSIKFFSTSICHSVGGTGVVVAS
ncbi:uncharacterized protein HMPREF1541_03534 [Cyphellophora europaea CBS 101466]|uniref:Uncharacterized protein n=1 Tax=Cyphellophora europaea (strain CBS 101466) TaxID=1220924 RepID=W2S0M9_CYPE1|nr:uncharacterized protein HMPREF1541_03534 [Cyphellophora europaea CBS 101466]ETN41598.1 hypothetical protein HMPREF1541_03534 [Cyphellophora europaea CBS 101466]